MTLDEIRTLFGYNRWATGRILEATRRLSPGDFTRDLRTSHGSVRGTLVHTLWAEWIWLERWLGTSPKQVFAEADFRDVAAIAGRWADVERDRQRFIAGLTPARLAAAITYENLQGKMWTYSLEHMMQHVANHSTYHRGQVVTLLRQLGQTPPATDFLVYFDEAGR